MKLLENIFEYFLWKSRGIVIVAVIFSLLVSFAMFFIATVDAIYLISHLGEYASTDIDAAKRVMIRNDAISHIVEVIDGYLLGTVLLIFSLGLYELFISEIDHAVESDMSSKVLIIRNLDDLKNRLAKVILMILIVKFFEHAIDMKFASPYDLLLLAGGIALLGLSLFLTHTSTDQQSGPGLQKPDNKES